MNCGLKKRMTSKTATTPIAKSYLFSLLKIMWVAYTRRTSRQIKRLLTEDRTRGMNENNEACLFLLSNKKNAEEEQKHGNHFCRVCRKDIKERRRKQKNKSRVH
jgi:hypothetical protein